MMVKYLEKYRMIVRKLKDWQPNARRIQFTRCHCPQRMPMLSYMLKRDRKVRGDMEDCGFYCTTCGFGNAGGRKTRSGKLEVDGANEITMKNAERIYKELT